jgi:hypothetical protein
MTRRSVFAILIFAVGLVPLILTAQQQPPFATGLEFADQAAYQGIPLASTPLMGNLPSNRDLSSHFPTPGQQGTQSSCVGWAVSALKTFQERVERSWSLNDPQHVFSPAFIYNQIRSSSDCRGGSSFLAALNLLRRDGAATLADFPYDPNSCAAPPTPLIKQNAAVFRIADWRRVNVQDETEVKNQITANFPVLIATQVDQAFMNLAGANVYTQFTGPSLGGHAMVVVGYDDAKSAFKVMNSWGTNWAAGGFGWIGYSAFRQMTREGYVAQDVVSPNPNPAPNPVPNPNPTPNRPTPPTPVPSPMPPAIPVATIGGISIVHNIQVNHAAGLAPGPGMSLTVQGSVSNMAGRLIQTVIRFGMPATGQLLFANANEPSYRDASGSVAVGIPVMRVTRPAAALDAVTFYIPYYALNLAPTNGAVTYALDAIATVYVDNFSIGQSQPVRFTVRW